MKTGRDQYCLMMLSNAQIDNMISSVLSNTVPIGKGMIFSMPHKTQQYHNEMLFC
jgi:hypothetical protein